MSKITWFCEFVIRGLTYLFFFTDTELGRKKKVKRSNTETEADASLSDNSCFVALVTASNLHKDALVLKLFIAYCGLITHYTKIYANNCCKLCSNL